MIGILALALIVILMIDDELRRRRDARGTIEHRRRDRDGEP